MKHVKRLLVTFSALVLLYGHALAQQNEPDRLESLKGDFSQSVVVAHVRISSFKVVRDLGGLYLYEVRALVDDPFKGRLKKGQTIKYYAQAPYAEKLRKEQQLIFFKEFMYEGSRVAIMGFRRMAGEDLVEALRDVRNIPQ